VPQELLQETQLELKMNALQPSGGRGRRISEFKASLVYKVSSRTARAAQRNPVSKKKKKKKKAAAQAHTTL
jgi:hypothetical protein